MSCDLEVTNESAGCWGKKFGFITMSIVEANIAKLRASVRSSSESGRERETRDKSKHVIKFGRENRLENDVITRALPEYGKV